MFGGGVLCTFADDMCSFFSSAIKGRIGGDEFVCIAERDISSYIAELRDLVSFVGKEKLYPLSVSLGYSRFDTRKDKSIDDLIKHCDKKLYDAKKRKA